MLVKRRRCVCIRSQFSHCLTSNIYLLFPSLTPVHSWHKVYSSQLLQQLQHANLTLTSTPSFFLQPAVSDRLMFWSWPRSTLQNESALWGFFRTWCGLPLFLCRPLQMSPRRLQWQRQQQSGILALFSSSHCVYVVYSGSLLRSLFLFMSLQNQTPNFFLFLTFLKSNILCLSPRSCSWSTGVIRRVCSEETSESLHFNSHTVKGSLSLFSSMLLFFSATVAAQQNVIEKEFWCCRFDHLFIAAASGCSVCLSQRPSVLL